MKIGIAFVKKDKRIDKTVFVVQYDNKIKTLNTNDKNVFIKDNTTKDKNNINKHGA